MTTRNAEAPLLCALDDPRAADLATCGGKSAGLHRLTRAGLPVPPGFCITTAAFDAIVARDPGVRAAITHLDACHDAASLRDGAAAVRAAVHACALPAAFLAEVVESWIHITERAPVAVRSSATAEDLADASFAGQQDSFLSIEGEEALAEAIRGCWASLFTERAVTYRRGRGVASEGVSMAVVVQRMVRADVAGVLFTADPLSGRRGVSVVEAVAGLGEALVSGHATPERYRVRAADGAVMERLGSDGAPLATSAGLLRERALQQLAAMGARAEAHAGAPQDIEWATEGGRLWLLQARAITTLWPLPEGELLPGWRVLVSFGHLQVYTAALSRVGSSLFRRLIPLARDPETGMSALVRVAGERVYVDATPLLLREPFRTLFPRFVAAASEPISGRLQAAAQREELRAVPDDEAVSYARVAGLVLPILGRAVRVMLGDPARERDAYVAELRAGLAQQAEGCRREGGLAARLDALFHELGNEIDWLLLRGMGPRLLPALAIGKLMSRLVPWLVPGADPRVLLQGLEGNVTTELDLALADLADLARDVPALVAALRSEDARLPLFALRRDPACAPFFRAWDAFIARHGHRAAGEIDPGVPRWREDPRVPLRSVAGALDRPPRALQEQHAALARRALELRDELVAAARAKPLGALLAPLVRGLVARLRTFHGLREEHKFVLVQTVDHVRTITLEAGALLAGAGAIPSRDDVWLLELNEVREAVRAVESGERPALGALLAARRASRARWAGASPPAVLTSEGEALAFVETRDAPPGSLAGTPVSGGVYEGVCRVVHDPASEPLGAGEVLVTRFTDPGWTPLFGHAGALVMEVGGQMTHGSVIAREIGIPAVVAVEGATTKLQSGARIRVDGDRGLVTVLEGGAS